MDQPLHILHSGDIFIKHIDCRLACNFCIHGIEKRLHRPGLVERLRSRLGLGVFGREPGGVSLQEELETIVFHMPTDGPDHVTLAGWDVLECPQIFELLWICRRHGKRIAIVSPGLRLAEREFAKRIARFDPSVTITYLSRQQATYADMSGHPDAKRLVEEALANLAELEVEFSVNFVVTSQNVGELTEVAEFLFRDLGIEAFNLKVFSPDRCYAGCEANWWNLLVSYERLDAELSRFAQNWAGTSKRLGLWRVPPCKLGHGVLSCDNIQLLHDEHRDPECRIWRHPSCDRCVFVRKCSFIVNDYRRRFGEGEFDTIKVNRVVDRVLAD